MPQRLGSTIYPVRYVFDDQDRACLTLRSIGHRAACQCGWKSPIRRQKSAARADLKWHRQDAHPDLFSDGRTD